MYPEAAIAEGGSLSSRLFFCARVDDSQVWVSCSHSLTICVHFELFTLKIRLVKMECPKVVFGQFYTKELKSR